ncbi:universal stress protein [Halalkalicoccus jeotgali]|uniref:UspA domain protein n=1 Tax=Halalkalicoccus jeotgali (strain DSM 18796 / CECT 7217 / JCM 14584 / KCTC 4019 / B3) TaxID=795797 RepID=D8JB13_HALJB|nr:universal stress protein [Halalkalicoccus jeotgali]ADJ16466.1 UspA domain protein [Halalkalicoccus jeotgali B3]ELY41439.1 UspA domain-containing protein [Halalkalicoccus jeotgali B3]
MAFHVLVPMNDSVMATKALEFALETYTDAEFTVLNVIGVPSWYMGSATGLVLSGDLPETARSQAESVFEAAREVASKHDIEITTIIDVGNPSRAITKRATDFDIVVIGGHERELSSRLLIGNVAATVTRQSPVPVTVVG